MHYNQTNIVRKKSFIPHCRAVRVSVLQDARNKLSNTHKKEQLFPATA